MTISGLCKLTVTADKPAVVQSTVVTKTCLSLVSWDLKPTNYPFCALWNGIRKATKRLANKSLVNCLHDMILHYSERGKKTRQIGEEVGRQHHGMDRPGVRQDPNGGAEHGKVVVKSSVVPQRPSRLRDR